MSNIFTINVEEVKEESIKVSHLINYANKIEDIRNKARNKKTTRRI